MTIEAMLIEKKKADFILKMDKKIETIEKEIKKMNELFLCFNPEFDNELFSELEENSLEFDYSEFDDEENSDIRDFYY